MKFIVYLTTNLVNNKLYIGLHKTNDPNVFDGYIGCGVYINNASTYMKPTTAFQYAVKKYGTNKFRRTTLAIFDSKEEALRLEKELVTKEFIKRPDVYNMTEGGIDSTTNSVIIYQFSLDGTLIKEWESMLKASDFYGISHSFIFNAIKFKGSCKDYYWSKEKSINIAEYTHYTGAHCYQYNAETGKMVGEYNSIYECAQAIGESSQNIQRAVKGGYIVKNFYYTTKPFEEFKGNPKTQLKDNYLYVYDLEGNYLTKLKGIKAICEYFGIKSNCVIYTAIRCNRPYKNYQFSLEYKEKLEPITNKRNTPKQVDIYTIDGEFVETINSIEETVKKYGTSVKRCLQGKQQQSKGFIFKYKSL